MTYRKEAPADDTIEAEEVLVSDQLNADDSTASYSTSIASSAADYPMEFGRRYHAFRQGSKYIRPNDQMEMDRLLIMHTVVTMAIGGLYRAPIDTSKAQRILDVGTGSGVWAIDMADALPDATILGTDLSANMPAFIPPNVRFEVDDVESDWAYSTPFTYIFSRYLASSIGNWPRLVGQVYENLEPGGWAEFQDFDLTYFSEDGSLREDDPMMVWVSQLGVAANKLGREPCPGHRLNSWVRAAGFVNVVHERYKLPIGPWPQDARLKQVGLHNYMQLNQGLEGLSLRLSTGVLGMTVDEVRQMAASVRQTLHNPNVHPILPFHVVYGQKPE